MDVADLRKLILRELDSAKQDAADRRLAVDAAQEAFGNVLRQRVVPLLRQCVAVLAAERFGFQTFAPAGSARLVSERSPQEFVEFELDPASMPPRVVGRVSLNRGRQGIIVEERAIGGDHAIADITDEDILEFLLPAVRRLVTR
jgi:hypothetical protein